MVKIGRCYVEKRERSTFKKIRILEMIEADLQLVMRMHLWGWTNERVESDKRSSKQNYGSREGHSIENALLETMLIFDHAKKTEESNVHAMSDLEACYNRQIPESCGL